MDLSPEERLIADDARAFASKKKNKKHIARTVASLDKFPREKDPVSVFMAGSPGAGKTEASLELIKQFPDTPILRIDADELRSEFVAYNGSNSHLFQSAVSLFVEAIHDHALKNSQSFILDGTLHSEIKARENIDRSLSKGRTVQILYVYQNPVAAWRFVQSREKLEGRRILPKDFIHQFFESKSTVNGLKQYYGTQIKVDLLIKNFDNSTKLYKAGIDNIDSYINDDYSPESLAAVIEP